MNSDDPDRQFTERLVRERLGQRFKEAILAQVLAAEQLLVVRKDALVDFLDLELLRPEEYAEKLNALLSRHLKDLAALIGAENCQAIYGHAPGDEVQLFSPTQFCDAYEAPRRVTISAESLVRVVVDEVGSRPELRSTLRDPEFQNELITVAQSITASADMQFSDAQAACYQASQLARFLATLPVEQTLSKKVIWRIAVKVIALHGLLIATSPVAANSFFDLVNDSRQEDRDTQNAAEWLLDRLIDTAPQLDVDVSELFRTDEQSP